MTWLMFAAIVFYAADSAFAAVSPYGYLDDGKEPPANPFLANSPWPMTHRNPYGQASSPYAGPSEEDELEIDFLGTALGTITLAYTNRDANGNYAIWENNAFHTAKIQDSGLSLSMIDKVSGGLTLDGLANAYYLLDNEGFLFVPKMRTLRSFTDAVSGDHLSGVVEVDMYELPDWALASPSDSLVGLSLMYDGYLVFSTAQGMVGVIRRDFTDLKVVQLGQGDEEVSNSFAVDEDGGIYVVTSKHMYRVQWNGSNLAVAWTANYEVGPEEQVGGRLGAGSGSTPTLMGTGAQDDKFVVITDGQPLMHLVLFWRDEIPVGWRPIAPDKDLRIAAEVPITFGDATAETSVSEQSVLVRGYGAVVVNNDYGIRLPEWVPDFFNQFMVGVTNLPGFAPYVFCIF